MNNLVSILYKLVWNSSSELLRKTIVEMAVSETEISSMNATSYSFLLWDELDLTVKNVLKKFIDQTYQSPEYQEWKITNSKMMDEMK